MGTFEVDFEKQRPTAPHRDGGAVKYRLDVVASSPADVVCSVGGWRMTGSVPAGGQRAVTAATRCPPVADPGECKHLTSIRRSRPRARECPARGLASRRRHVRIGYPHSAGGAQGARSLDDGKSPSGMTVVAVGHRTTTVQHVLSAAARAFKRHALTAAGIADTVGPTETLRSDMKACLPVDSELIPVG